MPELTLEPVAPVVTKTPEVTPEVKPTPTPVAKPAKEIEAINSIEDAVAVALKEVTLKSKDTPVAPVAAPTADTDADLDKEIAEATKDFAPNQREAFKKLRYDERAARRELKEAAAKLKELEAAATAKTELEAKLKEYETKLADAGKPNPELDTLKQKLADYDKEFASVKFEKTERYQNEIVKPLEAAEAIVKRIAEGNELKADDLLALLRYTGADKNRKLSEAMADLNTLDQSDLRDAVRSVEGLYSKREQLLANAQKELEVAELERARATEAEQLKRKQEWNEAQPKTWEAIKALVPTLAPVEGNDAWNQQLESAAKFAENKFEDFDTTSQVSILQRAGAFTLLAGAIKHKDAQIAELEADLAKYRAGSPGAEGHRKETPAADADQDFGSAVISKLQKSGALR